MRSRIEYDVDDEPAKKVNMKMLTENAVGDRADDSSPKKADGYLDKMLKLIPAEVAAAYLAIANIMGGDMSIGQMRWIVGILIVYIPIHMIVSSKLLDKSGKPLSKNAKIAFGIQIGATTLAFPVWVANISAPSVVKILSPTNYALDTAELSVILILMTLILPNVTSGLVRIFTGKFAKL